jgi:hypothetical protein
MLEKVPSTPNTDGVVRPGGVPIQESGGSNQNNERKTGGCC